MKLCFQCTQFEDHKPTVVPNPIETAIDEGSGSEIGTAASERRARPKGPAGPSTAPQTATNCTTDESAITQFTSRRATTSTPSSNETRKSNEIPCYAKAEKSSETVPK